jgi:RNA polymerase sigma factor (sigma-70 family)
MDDWQLLQDYAGTGSNQAFEALVRRHVDFVYSAALRQVRERHLAEDVTQGVFIVLSQKAAGLARQRPGVLAGWLFRVVRHTAANALKRERRRRRHEAKGGSMRSQVTNDDGWRDDDGAEWAQVAPHLDGAMAGLGETDRNAVLLRFFGGKSHRDVGVALGVSEEAAKKRVSRALERLRRILGRRGVAVPTAMLVGLIEANAVQAAPAGLVVAPAAAATGTSALLAKGAVWSMTTASAIKVTAAVAAAVLVVTVATTFGVIRHRGGTTVAAGPAPVLPVAAPGGGGKAPPAPAETAIRGSVLSADGEPLAGADVRVGAPGKAVEVHSDSSPGLGRQKTAGDGAFSFDGIDGPALVIIRHQLGYAQVTREQLAEDSRVVLRPWGRVEGVAKIGAKPAAGASISLERFWDWNDDYSRLLTHVQTTRTDDQGRFVFDRVAPGDAWVCRRTEAPRDAVVALQYVEVREGKTASASLGGAGRPVVGRIVLPAGSDERVDWRFGRGSGFNAALMPVNALPVGAARDEAWQAMTWEQRRIAQERYGKSVIGRFRKENDYGISFWIERDGSFRIEDVPAGVRRLSVSIYKQEGGPQNVADTVALVERNVIVEDLSKQGGRSDEPLDLGTLTLEVQQRLRVGKPAPPLVVRKLDGSVLKSSDLSGKFVLLVAWSEARRPTDADMAAIKQAHARHAKDGKLVILTVETNGDAAAAARLAKATGLDGVAINTTGQFSRGSVFTIFSSEPQNSMVYLQQQWLVTLIDPEGKVVAKNLNGEDIAQTVYRAMFER